MEIAFFWSGLKHATLLLNLFWQKLQHIVNKSHAELGLGTLYDKLGLFTIDIRVHLPFKIQE